MKVHSWIVIPLYIQQATIQLQLVVYGTKQKWESCLEKKYLFKLGYWQDYTNTIVYVKELMIPLVLEKGAMIPPKKTTQITLIPNTQHTKQTKFLG